jgi:hypothetical protein
MQLSDDGFQAESEFHPDSALKRSSKTCMKLSSAERKGKGKAVPLQAWSVPECSRKLRFPDFVTTAQDGGKVVSLTQQPPLPQERHLVLISVRG